MKRATKVALRLALRVVISIHALVKRATRCHSMYFFTKDISIHALVKRATFADFEPAVLAAHFNPRPREEGDGVLVM